MKKPVYHLHFGTGAFGLGFVTWLTELAGYKIILSNRYSKESAKKNDLLKYKRRYSIDKISRGAKKDIRIEDFFYYDKERLEILKVFANPDLSLITTSIKTNVGIPDICKILLDGVKIREQEPTSRKIFFIACENNFNSDDFEIFIKTNFNQPDVDFIERNVVFVNSVVDRICLPPEIDNGEIIVFIENYGKIYLPNKIGSRGGQYFKNMRKKAVENTASTEKNVVSLEEKAQDKIYDDSIVFVDCIEKQKEQKLIVVNGSHIILGLLAHYEDCVILSDFVLNNKEYTKNIIEIMTECYRIMVNESYDLKFEDWQVKKINELFDRFSSTPDPLYRILARFSNPENKVSEGRIEEFSDNVYSKIVRPSFRYRDVHEEFPDAIVMAAFRMMEMIKDRNYIS